MALLSLRTDARTSQGLGLGHSQSRRRGSGAAADTVAGVQLLMDDGWRDTFREQHPDVHGYTYYGYRFDMRSKKKGWRLDYVLTSSQLEARLHDSFILPDFLGSDHCPIGLTLKR